MTYFERARTPSNRNLPMVIGRFPSEKGQRMVWSEGSLERDYIRLVEFDPEIVRCQEQPVKIKYRHWPTGVVRLADDDREEANPPGGKLTHYTPDFYLERSARSPLMVEVKNEKQLEDPAVKRKLAAGCLLAESKDWEFRVVTEAIREGFLLENIRILQRYSRVPVPIALVTQVNQVLAYRNELTVGQLSLILAQDGVEHAKARTSVYALASKRLVAIDIEHRLIGPDSRISAPGGVPVGFGAATTGRSFLV